MKSTESPQGFFNRVFWNGYANEDGNMAEQISKACQSSLKA